MHAPVAIKMHLCSIAYCTGGVCGPSSVCITFNFIIYGRINDDAHSKLVASIYLSRPFSNHCWLQFMKKLIVLSHVEHDYYTIFRWRSALLKFSIGVIWGLFGIKGNGVY